MLRTRILAAATATLLALGMAAGGASPALANSSPPPPAPTGVTVLQENGTTCNGSGYAKPSQLDNLPGSGTGSYTPPAPDNWGTLAWNASTKTVTWTINAGWDVDICVKGGSVWPIVFVDTSLYTGFSYVHPQGLSHLGYLIVSRPAPAATASIALNPATCTTGETLNTAGFTATNATFGEPVITGNSYSVTATRTGSSLFDAGTGVSLDRTTKTFTGTLSPPDPELCPAATASIAFTAPDCTTGAQLDESSFSADGATLTSTSVIGSGYTVVFTRTGTSLFPAVVPGATVSPDRTTLTFSGTLDGPDIELCPVASASIDLTDPSCTTGAQLNPDGFDANGAELTSSTVSGSTYTVVFTGTGDALFPPTIEGGTVSDDRTTLTFTGTLAGPDIEKCPVASATIALTDPTCTTGELLNEGAFGGENVGEPEITVTGSTYTVVFTAAGDARFPATVEGAVVSDDRTTLTFTGTLAPKDERLCTVVTADFTLPPATCELGQDWENPIIDADAGVVAGAPEFDAEAQTVTIEFTATGANTFIIGEGDDAQFVKTISITRDVSGPNPELCDPPVKVTFCHATPVDDANKWEIITTATEAINFVDGHAEEHDDDIIPAFSYQYRDKKTGELIDGFFEGKNLETIFFGWTGQQILDNGCEVPELATAEIDVDPATCELPGALNQSGFEYDNATVEIVDDGSTDGTYEVVFTAEKGALFANGSTTKVFEGTLPGPNVQLCGEAGGSIATTLPTCELGATLDASRFSATNSTYEITDDGSDDGTYEVVFTADYGFRFPGGATTLTVDGELEERDSSLCELPTYELPVLPATCELGERLDVDNISADGATVEVVKDGTEDGTYEVVFTADDGYRFPGGATTLTVEGSLAGPNEEECFEAVAAIAVTDPDCFLGATLDESGFTSTGADYVIQVDEETGDYSVEFTAEEGYRFDTELEGVSDDGTTRTFTGTLAPPLEGEECVLPITDAFIAFIDPTCDTGEQLDEPNFEFDAELAELESVEVDENGDFTVVFRTLDEDTKFFQEIEGDLGTASHSAVTRTVSEGSTVLTFTGTLAGPNTELCSEPEFTAAIDAGGACESDVPWIDIAFSIEEGDIELNSDGVFLRFVKVDGEGGTIYETIVDVSTAGWVWKIVDGERVEVPGGIVTESGDYEARVLWPSAAVDAEGNAIAWPGWDYTPELGWFETAEGENDRWTRAIGVDPSIELYLTVNPTAQIDVIGSEFTYPPATPLCATDPVEVTPTVEIGSDCFGGTISLPDIEGVLWSVDGEITDQREWSGLPFDAAPVITALLDPERPGVFFAPGAVTEWTAEFGEPIDCLPTGPLTSASVTWTQPDCLGNPGSYTLTNGLGVIWTVDGITVAGNSTYSVAAGTTPTIEASLAGESPEYPLGFGWEDAEQQTLWNLSFLRPTNCDLPTLALTGASNALAGLGLAAVVIMMAGTGLVIARRREEARVQG